jgi:peptidoglycan/xylan/chitin deacetylase (PgdA/CDA1 family)
MRQLRQQAVAWLSSPLVQPVSELLSRLYAGLSTSLMYHRVVAGPVDDSISRHDPVFRPNLLLAVSERRFEEQLRELGGNYRCAPLAQAVQALKEGRLEPGTVTLTFDDGYRDNLRVALPLLERYGIPATIYITTGLIDRSAVLWWEEIEAILAGSGRLRFDWDGLRWQFDLHDAAARQATFERIACMFRQASRAEQRLLVDRLRADSGVRYSYDDEILDWDEVRELDRHPLITIAAHTVSHPVLRNLDIAAAADEMRQSRTRLEQELGHPVACFAYPFGGSDEAGPREFGLSEAEGFECAVTTRSGHWHAGHREHLHALPRIMVDYFDTLDDFRFKLSGLDSMMAQRGRRFVTA